MPSTPCLKQKPALPEFCLSLALGACGPQAEPAAPIENSTATAVAEIASADAVAMAQGPSGEQLFIACQGGHSIAADELQGLVEYIVMASAGPESGGAP